MGMLRIFSMNFLSAVNAHNKRQRKNMKKITNEITGHISMFSMLCKTFLYMIAQLFWFNLLTGCPGELCIVLPIHTKEATGLS
jgi:hypothetical protein